MDGIEIILMLFVLLFSVILLLWVLQHIIDELEFVKWINTV